MGTADKLIKAVGQRALLGQPAALLKALRPQQWIKNGLLFLPFVFSVRQAWSLENLDSLVTRPV